MAMDCPNGYDLFHRKCEVCWLRVANMRNAMECLWERRGCRLAIRGQGRAVSDVVEENEKKHGEICVSPHLLSPSFFSLFLSNVYIFSHFSIHFTIFLYIKL
jgi:hypothetical protein